MREPLSEMLSMMIPPEPLAPPNFTIIGRKAERILDDYGRPKARDNDPEAVLLQMRRRIVQDDWSGVPLSFAMEAADHAFKPEFRDRPDLNRVRHFFYDEIPASTRSGLLDALVRIYIDSFDAASEHTRRLATALKQVIARLGAVFRGLAEALPALFEPARVVQGIADIMVGLPDIWSGLRGLGLRQPHAPGLMTAAHEEFLALMAPRLTDRAEIERMLAWLKPKGQPALQSGGASTIEALLRPWRGSGIPADLKQLLMDSLLDFYGHPKVNRSAVWNQVPSDLEGMFLHWLTGADIRMLFRILTAVERGHMWKEREEFWWSLYAQKKIDEVWVAFNHDGFRAAAAELPSDQRGNRAFQRFGRQDGERNKSLLIMRIGSRIVVEGTYSFMVHIFDANARSTPRLYRSSYDVADIRHRPNLQAIQHKGDWQSRVMRAL